MHDVWHGKENFRETGTYTERNVGVWEGNDTIKTAHKTVV